MTRGHHSLLKWLLAGSMLAAAWPASAADVTPELRDMRNQTMLFVFGL